MALSRDHTYAEPWGFWRIRHCRSENLKQEISAEWKLHSHGIFFFKNGREQFDYSALGWLFSTRLLEFYLQWANWYLWAWIAFRFKALTIWAVYVSNRELVIEKIIPLRLFSVACDWNMVKRYSGPKISNLLVISIQDLERYIINPGHKVQEMIQIGWVSFPTDS